MALLEIKNLSFTYEGQSRKCLDGVDLTLENGEITLLCGASGCGKTTLLKMIKKELRPFGALEGDIYYGNEPLEDIERRRLVSEIGFVGSAS